MLSRVAQELIILARNGNMRSKHAAAIIRRKKIMAVEVNDFSSIHSRIRCRNVNLVYTLSLVENMADIKRRDKYTLKLAMDLKNKLNKPDTLACHAEENVISKYLRKNKHSIKHLHIVVVRVNSMGEVMMSKPCANCINIMRKHGIKKVTYSTDGGFLVTESLQTIQSVPSSGHRSMSRAIDLLDSFITC
jgi:deoxycytidylate deaminase